MTLLPYLKEASHIVGLFTIVLVSIVGFRLLFYYHSFFFHWQRYRQLTTVTTDELMALSQRAPLPFLKIQITTRGSSGSTQVIRRGIAHVLALVREAPDFYKSLISVEFVTESFEQKQQLEWEFQYAPLAVQGFVIPSWYETPNGTKLKARGLHYMVELRRRGVNLKPGRTFIVHYDEESVMLPEELRKLWRYLATTNKLLTEGPIYYPLEYQDASLICRAMEANRPVGCFECRHVMEKGTPLHIHGSNLVTEEKLENKLGWDIGTLDGEPFIAEDYVFGVFAYLACGPQIFGWHGAVMIEQPPFSFTSAFKQRHRWIIGVLQGMEVLRRSQVFKRLPRGMRFHLIWGTRYRVMTFALGLPTGAISLIYTIYQSILLLSGHIFIPLPWPLMAWITLVGFLWLNSIAIGAWYNLSSATQLSPLQKVEEGIKVIAMAPISGIMESTAAFWAVCRWVTGHRQVNWRPTPKTMAADNAALEEDRRKETVA